MAPFDPVGIGGENEIAAGGRQGELARAFGHDPRELRSARRLLGDEPARDALEARPPERPDDGSVERWTECLAADVEQPRGRIVGDRTGVGAHEAVERCMDELAALSGARIGIERLERL